MQSNKRRDGRGRSSDRLKMRTQGKRGVWAKRAAPCGGALRTFTRGKQVARQPSDMQISEKWIAQTLDSACSQQMNEVNGEEVDEIGPVKKRRHFLSLHGAFKCLIIFNSM